MKNTKKFTPPSIFNKDLQITEELFAVTYGKRSYSSLDAEDPWLTAEHAFIIIQGSNMFYRAEIARREIPPIETIVEGEKILTPANPDHDYVIKDKQESFCNERTFNQVQPAILKHKELTDIVNHTWLVPIDKVEELMADIEADMGSIHLKQKNAILYFGLGNESLLYEDKGQDFLNECLRLTAVVGGVSVGLLQLKSFITDCNTHKELKSSATHLCENAGCAYDGLKKTVGLMTAAFSPFWTRAILDSKLEPKKQFPKVHSCATWAAEKLHNLGIEEIDNDLQPSILVTLIDKIGYLTSLHTGNLQEVRTAAVALCPPKETEINVAMDSVEGAKERKNNLMTEDHKTTRCVIASGGALIAAIATSKVKDVVVDNCFDR